MPASCSTRASRRGDGGHHRLLRWRLARYKLPRSVEFVDVLPRNTMGKVLRRELRDRYWQGHQLRVR